MNRLPLISALLLLLSLAIFQACIPEQYGLTEDDLQVPTNVSAEIIVAEDESGIVTVIPSADNAITFHVYAGQSATEDVVVVSPGGSASLRYSASGTYIVRIIAFGAGAIASTYSEEISVEVAIRLDPEVLTNLTNNSSKTWYWAAAEPGHLGVGPSDNGTNEIFFPAYYAATPFEKAGGESACLYMGEMTFSLENGQIFFDHENFGQTYFNVGFQDVAGGTEGFDFCYDFDVTGRKNVSIFPSEAGLPDDFTTGNVLNIGGGGFMSYYIGTSSYEILELTANRMYLRAIPGNDPALAWYLIFSTSPPFDDPETEYTDLVWADEFDVDGAPDPANWGYNTGTGDGGWGNGEAQFYTDRPENIIVEDGVLKITAIRESFGGQNYTSARITTENKQEFTYGRMVARAKLPTGGGTWPAIWTLGEDYATNIWPACGEIDIMEHVGNDQDRIFGSLHYPGNFGGSANTGSTMVPGVSDEFHVYEVDWSPTSIRFYVDDLLYHSFTNDGSTPFNSDFFFILNVAMGGTFGGDIDPNFMESTMEVDYVRLYQ